MGIGTEDVRKALHGALEPLGFVSTDPPEGVHAAWVRKTWNTNRGVVLVETSDGARWAQDHKLAVGKALGYFPFLYGMGLQVVAVAPEAVVDDEVLGAAVDRIDNQRSIVQSVFGLDLATGAIGQGRTWGQLVTGRFQDAIASALADVARGAAGPVGVEPPDADNPFAAPR